MPFAIQLNCATQMGNVNDLKWPIFVGCFYVMELNGTDVWRALKHITRCTE